MRRLIDIVMSAWRRFEPLVRPYTAAEPMAGRFRARQLKAVLRLTPLTMAANALNIVIIAHAFRDSGLDAFIAAWALSVAVLLALGMRAWLRWRRSLAWTSASRRAMRRATLHASLLAGLWGLMLLVVSRGANDSQQLLLATIATGMVCAGGFALATVPLAGTAFVVVLGACAGIAFVTSGFPVAPQLGVLIVAYTAIVISSVWATARLFGARLMSEAEAERQNEVIGLLLRDFEENSSDMLWEIDAKGHLVHVSPQLERLFGQPASVLQTRPFLDWLRQLLPDDETAVAQLKVLDTQMIGAQPFRDLPSTSVVGVNTRFWQNSAKPLIDATGMVVGWRGVSTDVTAAQSANRQLTWLAHFDALTGLANRHEFRIRMNELLGKAGLPARPFALLCLDLDHFKTVNDTLGHTVGDGLLQGVAERLRGATRRGDTVARLGGDEFALILNDVACAAEAQALTEHVLDNLREPCDVQRRSHRGAGQHRRGPFSTRRGRHRRLALQRRSRALCRQVGRPRHHAPVRARHGGDHPASPARRTSLGGKRCRAGNCGLSSSRRSTSRTGAFSASRRCCDGVIPNWVTWCRRNSFRWLRRPGSSSTSGRGCWKKPAARPRAGSQSLRVSVNVSPAQTRSGELCALTARTLAATGLAPQQLELEITESIFLHENGGAIDVLHGLRKLGARVALDDFGTGYSALAYLRRFPFDTLKIDRSFVRELMERRDARAIVRMILALARTLNMSTVAEGVEEPAQAGLLGQHGCDAIQGISRLASPREP